MDVLMPQLGETVAEGKITRWFKSAGEPVRTGENLCEIETDKVTVEVPALSDGVLKSIRVEAGNVVPVGTVIAILGDSAAATGDGPSAPAPAAPDTKARVDPDPFREVSTPDRNFGPARLRNGALTTPLARRLAAGASLDLNGVAGSGPHGRITGRDVERAIASRQGPSAGAIG